MGFQIFNKKVVGRSNFSRLIDLFLFLQIKKSADFFNFKKRIRLMNFVKIDQYIRFLLKFENP